MIQERWRALEELVQAALERKPDQRDGFLKEACPDDDLRREAESLLAYAARADEILDNPIRVRKAATIQPGTSIGPYQIVGLLGAGGMGVVYQARDTRLGRGVALKILPADMMSEAGRRQRFMREAQAASRLNHPNIVTIHDIGEADGILFIAMEYVSGKTLDEAIPHRGLPLAEALKYAVQIADACATAHAAHIVHRDLKPGNVMVTVPAGGQPGTVKVLDFGIAKWMETAASPEVSTVTLKPPTQTGMVLGTPAFMSPEQAEGKAVDARSDIFSFGAVLYQMVTGKRAFHGDSTLAMLAAVLHKEPEPLPAHVPHDLQKVIARCLRKDPARRFQSMADVKVELEEIREDPGQLAAAQSEAQRQRIPKWAWTVALPLIAIAVAAGAWRLVYPAPKPPEAMNKILLTSYPGSETSPTFSPDGRQIAFAWNGENRGTFDLYVKLVEGGDPLRLTYGSANAVAPQWSPDGRFIAFCRNGAVYLISPLGGSERKIADVTDINLGLPTTAWTPDSKSIALSDGAIFLLNLESRERRQLTSPPALSGGDGSPRFSPDGKSLAFVRRTSAAGNGAVFIMALADGALRKIEVPNDFLYQLVWTPDGKDVLAGMERGGARAIWRVPVYSSGPPSRVAGLDDGANSPAVSAVSHRLAYSLGVYDENIWSLSGATPTQLIASTRRDFDPQFSTDESKIAFVSDRSGGWEIYTSDSEGGHVAQLTSFGHVVADGVRWSPDGREIVFAMLQVDNRDIYVVPSEGGAVRRLTKEPSDEGRPSYSMDGKWIYFRSNRSGGDEIWRMARDGAAPTQVTHGGGFEAVESLDGKTLYFLRGRNTRGLWSMPPEGGPAQPIGGLEGVWQGRWGVTQDGVCYIGLRPGSGPTQVSGAGPILCWNRSTGKTSRRGTVDKPIFIPSPGFSVSRDGRRILWNQTDHVDADLVLVDNFR